MSKRLAMLEMLTEQGSKDSFHWYALALEYANAERVNDAVRTFEALRAIDAGYVPMYLMCARTRHAPGSRPASPRLPPRAIVTR